MMRCRRCNYPAYDYCLRCAEPLCDHDMLAGCCGDTPAQSGAEQEFADNYDAVMSARYSDLGIPTEDLR
jgi:hypothetical protein